MVQRNVPPLSGRALNRPGVSGRWLAGSRSRVVVTDDSHGEDLDMDDSVARRVWDASLSIAAGS